MRSARRRASRRRAGLLDHTAGMKMPTNTSRGMPTAATAIQGLTATEAEVAASALRAIGSRRLTGQGCWPSQNPSDWNRVWRGPRFGWVVPRSRLAPGVRDRPGTNSSETAQRRRWGTGLSSGPAAMRPTLELRPLCVGVGMLENARGPLPLGVSTSLHSVARPEGPRRVQPPVVTMVLLTRGAH